MKKLIYLFTVIPLVAIGQQKNSVYVYNSNGKLTSVDSLFNFDHKTHHLWGTIHNDSIIYQTIETKPLSTDKVIYKRIYSEIQKHQLKIAYDNSPIVLAYNFKDDICHNNPLNKSFLEDQKKIALNELGKKHQAVNYYQVFEQGVDVKYQKDFILIDSNGYFKTNLFDQPALCGALIIVYPNNDYKIYYGERAIFEIEK